MRYLLVFGLWVAFLYTLAILVLLIPSSLQFALVAGILSAVVMMNFSTKQYYEDRDKSDYDLMSGEFNLYNFVNQRK